MELAYAQAELSISDGYFRWTIRNCPFCGGRHKHGGGKVGEDDPREYLGWKIQHCMWRPEPGSYCLIEGNADRTNAILQKALK